MIMVKKLYKENYLHKKKCKKVQLLLLLSPPPSLNCWQVQHDVPVTEIFEFNVHVNFLYFL